MNNKETQQKKTDKLFLKNSSSAIARFFTPDSIILNLMRTFALLVIGFIVLIFSLLYMQAYNAIDTNGFGFLTSTIWNPVTNQYGSLALIYGTFITSLIAIAIASPISICIALTLTEIFPRYLAKPIGIFIEMIAAIPSIVFGLWGIFYISPLIKNNVAPFLTKYLGFIPFFDGPSFGVGILNASIILTIMIIPTITSICRETFLKAPQTNKEALLALASTKYEMIKYAVLKPSLSGISGAIALGLGRALGETMAVAMVIGNQPQIVASIFSPGATMASIIANEYAEADSELHISALCLVGFLLFFISLLLNIFSRSIIHKRIGITT